MKLRITDIIKYEKDTKLVANWFRENAEKSSRDHSVICSRLVAAVGGLEAFAEKLCETEVTVKT